MTNAVLTNKNHQNGNEHICSTVYTRGPKADTACALGLQSTTMLQEVGKMVWLEQKAMLQNCFVLITSLQGFTFPVKAQNYPLKGGCNPNTCVVTTMH